MEILGRYLAPVSCELLPGRYRPAIDRNSHTNQGEAGWLISLAGRLSFCCDDRMVAKVAASTIAVVSDAGHGILLILRRRLSSWSKRRNRY